MEEIYRLELREGIGQYWNKRFEVVEKYSYYEDGRYIEDYHIVFHSKDKERCMEYINKYNGKPKRKINKLPYNWTNDDLPFYRQ